MKKIGIGFVGTGDISGIYLKNLTQVFCEVEVVGVCDLVREKAEAQAEKYGIKKIYGDMYELFADPAVDIVLNITRPYEHYEVTKAALEAGKHVYSEKPLAAEFEKGVELVRLAEEKKLLLGGAPDTFMGAGLQTCRRVIDSGFIGTPVGGAAFMICRGHETWHPDPEFYYKHGGGPMLDMGPYYITALINMLGGVQSVMGMAQTPYTQRIISSEPKYGTVIDVDVPTTVAGIMQFESGALGTVYTTFDVSYKNSARLEIYGSEGTLICIDPNNFGGEVKLLRRGESEYGTIPLMFGYGENSRGVGLADMAKALSCGRSFRANCGQTLHALEIMTAFEVSGKTGKRVDLTTKYERGAPMVFSELAGILD